uniref:Uncharacterized protein n=1 Tax=Glossina palpalis gambiensis TaxID=67801 RepID=A0A1B0B269_9MUSC
MSDLMDRHYCTPPIKPANGGVAPSEHTGSETEQKQPRNFKLISDPALIKGATKLYRLRIDQNDVGAPPAIEITITNLNDKQFLARMLEKCGSYDELAIYHHPPTVLEMSRVVFATLIPYFAHSFYIFLHSNSRVVSNVKNIMHILIFAL